MGEAVFDRHVLALNIACVTEALAKRAQPIRLGVERCWVEKSDHWHPRLLRARREGHAAAAPPSSVMNSRRLIR